MGILWPRGRNVPDIPAIRVSHIGGKMPDPSVTRQRIAVGQLQGKTTRRFAQPITFDKPVCITEVSLLLSEQAKDWNFRVLPQPADTLNRYTLRR